MKILPTLLTSIPAILRLRFWAGLGAVLWLGGAQAAVVTVTNTNDSGVGSLRGAVAAAGAGDTIEFAVAGTITLGTGEIAIDKNLTITGPGAGVLMVSGGNTSRIFNIGSVTPAINVAISGLTVANGRVASSTGANGPQPPQQGGGIFSVCTGTLRIVGCAVSGNTVISGDSGFSAVGAGMGGGIYAGAGVLQLTGSTFSNNTSQGGRGFDVRAGSGRGGAVCTAGSAAVHVVHCTFTANAATGGAAQADFGGDARGGGLYHGGSGGAQLTNCTVAGNSATGGTGSTGGSSSGQGGGLARAGSGTVTVVNTIVAANTASTANPDVSGAFPSAGANLIGALGTATGFANGVNGDQVGSVAAPINPQLGGLANNGGPTRTMALLGSSPAINAGASAAAIAAGLAVDQRGYVRFVGGAVDIGALESGAAVVPAALVVTTAADKLNFDNTGLALREALFLAKGAGTPETVTFSTTTAGGAVNFADGTVRTIALASELAIDSSVTITGPGAGVLTVSGENAARIFKIGGVAPAVDVAVSGLRLANGRAQGADAAGGFNQGAGSGQGGAIYNASSGTVSLTDCAITSSTAQGGSGQPSFGGGGGGGLGGAIYHAGGGALQLLRTTLTGNGAAGGPNDASGNPGNGNVGFGGGICNAGTGSVQATDSTFANNHVSGGEVGFSGGDVRGAGAGIGNVAGGAVSVSGCTFLGNTATGGYGYSRNAGSGLGAGIYNEAGPLSVDGSSFLNNHAAGGDTNLRNGGSAQGGGIYLNGAGSVTVSRSTFATNSATGGFASFSNTSGSGQGGAIANGGVGLVSAVNVTFAGNTAAGGNSRAITSSNYGLGQGGGIANVGTGSIALTNVTLSANAGLGGRNTDNNQLIGAARSGGLANLSTGSVTLGNAIVAANTATTADPDASGAFISAGHNLIGNAGAATGFTGAGDQVGTGAVPINPQLGPLQNNGGPTLTLALATNSPAINAGSASGAPATDQRGKLRPQFGVVDIGAYEQTPFDTGQTIVNVGGAFWYLGPDAVGGDLRVYREVPGLIAEWVDGGLGVRIGQALDGTVLVENSSGGVYARTDSTTGRGTAWQLLTSVTAGDGATWFLGPDGIGPDFYIYRWAANEAPTYSFGYGTQLTLTNNGSILAQNNAGNLYLRVGSNAGLGSVWQLQNRNSVAGTDTIRRYPTQSVKVLLSTLLANDSDPDGDTPLAITAVNAPASGQATVTLSGGRAFYQPAAGFTGADTFTYQLSDGHGGTATGTVQVDIIGGAGLAQNITKIALLPGGSAGISFAAIPGRTYRVESTDSLASLVWQNRGLVTADARGRIDFTDPPPLPPSRFYRTVAQ